MPLKKLFKYDLYFEVLDETKKTIQDIDRIEITKCDDESIKLEAFSGDVRVKCIVGTPDDDHLFDFNICAKTAIDILYKDYDMTPKPKRKLYNGKIFMRADTKSIEGFFNCKYTRENKIWDVKDGKIIGIGGALRPVDLIYEDMTDEELSKLLTKSNSVYIGYFYNIVDGYFVR